VLSSKDENPYKATSVASEADGPNRTQRWLRMTLGFALGSLAGFGVCYVFDRVKPAAPLVVAFTSMTGGLAPLAFGRRAPMVHKRELK
jgi:hypothetical protein